MQSDFEKLYSIAKTIAQKKQLTKSTSTGRVGVALLSSNNNIYTGICLETICALGFCAETAAISSMIKNNENKISKLVAVYNTGEIVSPCGKCRELMYQINEANLDCEILLQNKICTLKDLLPEL